MMIDRNCEHCGKPFKARNADVKRGWGNFCSKSCKAKKQEQKTGQYAKLLSQRRSSSDDAIHDAAMASTEVGWDAHKDVF